MRKFIYLNKTTIVAENSTSVVNGIQQKSDILISINNDGNSLHLRFDTDQANRLISEIKEVIDESVRHDRML